MKRLQASRTLGSRGPVATYLAIVAMVAGLIALPLAPAAEGAATSTLAEPFGWTLPVSIEYECSSDDHRVPFVVPASDGSVGVTVEAPDDVPDDVTALMYWTQDGATWHDTDGHALVGGSELEFLLPGQDVDRSAPLAFAVLLDGSGLCEGGGSLLLPGTGLDVVAVGDAPFDVATEDLAAQVLVTKAITTDSMPPAGSGAEASVELCDTYFSGVTPCDVLDPGDGGPPEWTVTGEPQQGPLTVSATAGSTGELSTAATCTSVVLGGGHWFEAKPSPDLFKDEGNGRTESDPSYDANSNSLTVFQRSRTSMGGVQSLRMGGRVGTAYVVRPPSGSDATSMPVKIELRYHSGARVYASAGAVVYHPTIPVPSGSSVGDSWLAFSAGHGRISSSGDSISPGIRFQRSEVAHEQYNGFYPTWETQTLPSAFDSVIWDRQNLVFDQPYATFAEGHWSTFAESAFNTIGRGETWMDDISDGWYLYVPWVKLTALDGWGFVC